MKYIKKQQSPTLFEEWKKQVDLEKQILDRKKGGELWNLFHSTCPPKDKQEDNIVYYSKKELREELLKEQGFICCYCNQSLKNDPKTIIEHLHDKDSNLELTFEYNNLLVSCNGGQKDPKPKKLHCDAEKKDKTILVTPLETDCETHFYFDISGKIFSNTDNGEKTIKELNLNIKKLQDLRAGAIDGFLFNEDFEVITENEAKIILENIYTTDVNSHFIEFCFAVKNVLESEFPPNK